MMPHTFSLCHRAQSECKDTAAHERGRKEGGRDGGRAREREGREGGREGGRERLQY
jgi:hypothetical protein